MGNNNHDRYAPLGKIWVCTACGKVSPSDRYGNSGSTPGWDESCVLNSVLVSKDDVVDIGDGRVMITEKIRGGSDV